MAMLGIDFLLSFSQLLVRGKLRCYQFFYTLSRSYDIFSDRLEYFFFFFGIIPNQGLFRSSRVTPGLESRF